MYSFGVGEEQIMYISSGDMMTRNTENRIEICCPVENKAIKEKIKRNYRDNFKRYFKSPRVKSKKTVSSCFAKEK